MDGGGWLATDFGAVLELVFTDLQAGRIDRARKSVKRLRYQAAPSKEICQALQEEASAVLDDAYARYSGFAAAGAYHNRVENSAPLGLDALRGSTRNSVASWSHPTDRWQAFTAGARDPIVFRVDARWAIYWTMFRWAQDMSLDLEAGAIEDNYSGRAMAYLRHALSGWGNEHLRKFGYPETPAYIGNFETAGPGIEPRLGSDFGLMVNIEIGPFVCRKVALFQAKRAHNGNADVGSHSGQLATLARRPDVGYYLFHHQSDEGHRAPSPAVHAVADVVNRTTTAGKSLSDTKIGIEVRDGGWDLAAFMAFGLCDPASDIGRKFNDVEEGMRILGDGKIAPPPSRMFVYAIADKARVETLRLEIRRHRYRELDLPDLQVGKDRGMERSIDDDFEMSFP
ncbi:hypothetical protein PMI06_008454 [Burkholderia sp. BT03]|nr:hypothetical protein PMI06_008454 [Burkholderia sp. BT03]SKC47800.1 hypothetical protein SAMN06266956_0177 [Paraburkholderia hospita]